MTALVHVVDDDAAVRDSLKLLLESSGYRVRTFSCGEDFCACLDVCDCLVLDVNLPGDDGFQVLAKLRHGSGTVPAILMSGRADARMQRKAAQAGAIAFFEKPVSPKELLAAIARATRDK